MVPSKAAETSRSFSFADKFRITFKCFLRKHKEMNENGWCKGSEVSAVFEQKHLLEPEFTHIESNCNT